MTMARSRNHSLGGSTFYGDETHPEGMTGWLDVPPAEATPKLGPWCCSLHMRAPRLSPSASPLLVRLMPWPAGFRVMGELGAQLILNAAASIEATPLTDIERAKIQAPLPTPSVGKGLPRCSLPSHALVLVPAGLHGPQHPLFTHHIHTCTRSSHAWPSWMPARVRQIPFNFESKHDRWGCAGVPAMMPVLHTSIAAAPHAGTSCRRTSSSYGDATAHPCQCTSSRLHAPVAYTSAVA